MTAYGHMSVKNQIIPGKYHHKNSTCAARFATFRIPRTLPDHDNNGNSRGPQ